LKDIFDDPLLAFRRANELLQDDEIVLNRYGKSLYRMSYLGHLERRWQILASLQTSLEVKFSVKDSNPSFLALIRNMCVC
jgi:hypothetical protein